VEQRRILGTELDVSPICFGMMYGSDARKDPELKKQALRRGLESGVNFIHSCMEYGTWPVLAEVLDDWPERRRLVHAIKMIFPEDEDENSFYPDKFRRRVEDHLAALRTERIDILQYQWRVAPGSDMEPLDLFRRVIDDVVTTFETLRDEGKAGYLMVFPSASCKMEVIETGYFSGMISVCNLARLDFGALYTELERRDMGLLGFSPLQGGSLTDRHHRHPVGESGDRRSGEFYEKEYKKRERIVAFFGDEIGPSMTSFALRSLLSTPVVGSLITGMSTADQVDEIVSAVEQPALPPDTFRRAVDLWRTELEPLENA
jgi:aryl-alcohol dehydrogenase-like predicted oxidoreductase